MLYTYDMKLDLTPITLDLELRAQSFNFGSKCWTQMLEYGKRNRQAGSSQVMMLECILRSDSMSLDDDVFPILLSFLPHFSATALPH